MKVNLAVVGLTLCAGVMPAQRQAPLKPFDQPDANPQYFPKGTFDDFASRWYAQALRAMKEPSISAGSDFGGVDVYRFLWLRTFDQPIAVRLVVKPDASGTVHLKVTSGKGGYDPGRVIVDQSVPVSAVQVGVFRTLLKNCPPPARRDAGGNDGAQWIMEVLERGHYQARERWSPEPGDKYREVCLYLLGLTKFTVAAKDSY